MSWNAAEPWQPARRYWWGHLLESEYAFDTEIVAVCGPEYLMYHDIAQFGNESAKGVWP